MKDLSRLQPTPHPAVGLFLIVGFLYLALSAQATDPSDIKRIDINSAPLEDLVKIIHIGKVRAEELISLRPFSSLDDLARIKGISKIRVEDIKKQGLAWVETEGQIETEKGVKNSLKETTPEGGAKEEPKKELAAVSKQLPESLNSLYVLLIAFLLAIFSGIIILILKRRIKIS